MLAPTIDLKRKCVFVSLIKRWAVRVVLVFCGESNGSSFQGVLKREPMIVRERTAFVRFRSSGIGHESCSIVRKGALGVMVEIVSCFVILRPKAISIAYRHNGNTVENARLEILPRFFFAQWSRKRVLHHDEDAVHQLGT